MELRQLRQFVAVVETGNVSSAANVLHLTQPALTRTIKNLEADLKTQLLERKPRGVIPTDAGKNLYAFAKLILNETDRAKKEIISIANGFQGHIKIGCASLFANNLIAQVIDRILTLYPRLNVSVQEGFFEDLVEALQRAEIDLIVCNFPPTHIPADLKLEPLTTIQSYFVVGRDHRLARKRSVTIEELYDEHWAISKHPHFAEFIDKFMSRNVSAGPGSVETNSLSVLKHLVMTGHFVSIMATHWIEAELKSGAIVPLSLPGTPLTRPAGIILRDTMHQRPPVRKMIEVVRDVLGIHKEAQTPKASPKRK